MSKNAAVRCSRKKATLGTIFISVITVGGIALSGLVDSPAKGIALVLTGLALAAVVNRVLKIWSGRVDLSRDPPRPFCRRLVLGDRTELEVRRVG